MSVEIPDKLHFKIGEVSTLAGVAPHVLRYWESEFKEIKPKRAGSRQRLYRREDVELILVIKQLVHDQGYTIAGARKLLRETADISSLAKPEQPGPPDAAAQLAAIKQELLEVRKLLEPEKDRPASSNGSAED